ncbi:MAG: death-on-curing protein [Planctomycetes bacterium]|nr:death-on-curing protein [Planctomycetota bacterium]
MNPDNLSKGQVIVYKNTVEVRLEKETVWLTQKQMAELFDTERSVITKHLRNIFESKELEEKSNVQKMHLAHSDKPVLFYNLDAIISVGYRVNSKQGTQFRIWATNVLRKHLVDGYTINENRLKSAAHKYLELQKTLKLLGNVIHFKGVSDEAKGLIRED